MKELLILRHAKSSWANAGQDDHDRPLNARGRAAATALGEWIRATDLEPNEIFCSSAARTVETAQRLKLLEPICFLSSLYHALPNGLRAQARKATSDRVLMVGHNPGIASFAAQCAKEMHTHHRFKDYPTGALTVLRFPFEDWRDLTWQSGEIVDFLVPADLPKRQL